MKLLPTFVALAVLALGAYPVIAHHAAEGMVDEEIYEMIDAMVADTPHADLVFDDDMGNGMTEIDITADRVQDLEELIEEGLLGYVDMLDGDVTLSVDFSLNRTVILTIIQVESAEDTGGDLFDSDKAGETTDPTTLDNLKAGYR